MRLNHDKYYLPSSLLCVLVVVLRYFVTPPAAKNDDWRMQRLGWLKSAKRMLQFYQHITLYIYTWYNDISVLSTYMYIYICDIYLYIYTYYQHFQIFLSLLQCSKKHQKVTMKVAHNSCDPRYPHPYHICWSSSWWFFGGSYGQGWMGLAQVVEVALVNLAAKLNQQKKHTKNNQVGQFVFFLLDLYKCSL